MEKEKVIQFFDERAEHWDDHLEHNDVVINMILDNAGVEAGKEILDVACGTGVLFGDYLNRNVAGVTGIDISPKMAEIAQKKFEHSSIHVICADVEKTEFDKLFDCIVVYNAFPHFPDPDALIKRLSSMVKKGGSVTVAHGMSRKMLDRHHSGVANGVSNRLMSEDDLAEIFSQYLTVTVKISDDNMYQLVGIKEK